MTTYTEKLTQCNSGTGFRSVDVLLFAIRQWNQARSLKADIARERRQLSELPTEMLKDIGISRADAEIESRRSDVPGFRIIS